MKLIYLLLLALAFGCDDDVVVIPPPQPYFMSDTAIYLGGTTASNGGSCGAGYSYLLSDSIHVWDNAGGEWDNANAVAGNSKFIWHFARRLQHEFKKPVYIVFTQANGNPIEYWLGAGGGFSRFNNYVNNSGVPGIDIMVIDIGTANTEPFPQNCHNDTCFADSLHSLMTNFYATDWLSDSSYFLAGQCVDNPVYNGRDDVLLALNDDLSDRNACSVSKDLGTCDGLHYNQEALVTFGYERHWNAFKSLWAP